MGALKYRVSLLICFILAFHNSVAEIHRAKASSSRYHSKQVDGRENVNRGMISFTETVFLGHTLLTWILSTVSAVLVGLCGIFPLLVIPLEAGKALRHGAAASRLNLLLSFAVGGLLGDVFLHLLPEAWQHVGPHDHAGHMSIGFWILVGILSFLIIEKIFPDEEDEEDTDDQSEKENTKQENTTILKTKSQSNGISNGVHTKQNGTVSHRKTKSTPQVQNGHNNQNETSQNGAVSSSSEHIEHAAEKAHIKTSGWLNLTANVIDNFTHGLAVAGSYCAGTKVGLITTFAILLHEIPHEVGDFAILLRSGFDRWKAAKAQILTASGGLIGAITALASESATEAGNRTAWILPFTSGGFIYIALVTVVPDLLKETDPKESIKQVLLLLAGIGAMAAVTILC